MSLRHRKAVARLLAAALFFVATGVTWGEDLLTFGTAKGRLDHVDSTAGSEAKITFGEEFLKLVGPNWWSCRWQFNNIGLDLTERKPADTLQLEISGSAPDEGSVVKVLLFSADWKKKSVYTVDLSKIKKDEFTLVKADQKLSDPAEKEGGGVDITVPVGNVMFITAAKGGNSPILLKIKSLSVVNDQGK